MLGEAKTVKALGDAIEGGAPVVTYNGPGSDFDLAKFLSETGAAEIGPCPMAGALGAGCADREQQRRNARCAPRHTSRARAPFAAPASMVAEVSGVKATVHPMQFDEFEDAVDVVQAPWSPAQTTVVMKM